jgi:hypothetical protein
VFASVHKCPVQVECDLEKKIMSKLGLESGGIANQGKIGECDLAIIGSMHIRVVIGSV